MKFHDNSRFYAATMVLALLIICITFVSCVSLYGRYGVL